MAGYISTKVKTVTFTTLSTDVLKAIKMLIDTIPDCNTMTLVLSGQELDHVKESFFNIPMSKNLTEVSYHGDLAKFILSNW